MVSVLARMVCLTLIRMSLYQQQLRTRFLLRHAETYLASSPDNKVADDPGAEIHCHKDPAVQGRYSNRRPEHRAWQARVSAWACFSITDVLVADISQKAKTL